MATFLKFQRLEGIVVEDTWINPALITSISPGSSNTTIVRFANADSQAINVPVANFEAAAAAAPTLTVG